MGLDITHYKATHQLSFDIDLPYIGGDILGNSRIETRETFAHFNVPFEHFKNYIQQVHCPEIQQTAIIVKDPKNLSEVKSRFKNNNYTIFIDNLNLQKELANYEASEKLDKLHRHIDTGEFRDWRIVSYYSTIQKEGIYFKSIGDQRKHMNENFHLRFCDSSTYNYALEDNFTFAFSCLEKRDDETENDFKLVKENFTKNFLETFELGASFFTVSY